MSGPSRRIRRHGAFLGRRSLRRAFAGLAISLALAPGSAAEEDRPLEIGEGERLLVIAPHPDDESLCCAGLIQAVLVRGGSARVVTLTAGDGFVEAVHRETGSPMPRSSDYEDYGELRIGELRNAVRVLGHGRVRVDVLGFPDGVLRTLLREHWKTKRPQRSPTTGETSPPYPEALDRGARYAGADVLRELRRVLQDTAPTLVALPDPEDAHPDHAATGIFGLLALGEVELEKPRELPPPRVLAYLVHWQNWPPAPDTASGDPPPLALPAELASRKYPRVALPLDAGQLQRKIAALGEHATQQRAMGGFLALLARRDELFTLLDGKDVARARKRAEASLGSDAADTPGEGR